ncbi:DeoR/GlpR family DNA-binding transcription regulator [Brucella grignonensis]|uniref:HTH domain protein n=1 Tax=Brucella grignonensis TaxID=94627 RepID=A0A256F1S4_9HYPH|nr:DeoR/GlpR family DNA-binding transcription regulator [Brucella grignonensis]OYR08646.1 HTH domain protein [Brucella grignonensis]
MTDKLKDSQPAEAKRLPARVRHAHLVDAARKRGFLQVTDIAAEIGVSEMTIRRDLVELERGGLLVRTHGGAVIDEEAVPETFLDREEPAFSARLREYNPEKMSIVAKASELVERRMSVALDVGSTTYLLAEALRDTVGVKFFTSSLRTAQLLGGARREVYVPAGQIRGEELSICGKSACDEFERLWFDIAFIGVSGITSDGLFDYSPEDSDLKRVYLRRANRKVLLCHSAKFNHMSLIRIADLNEIDLLITDAPPPPNIASALSRANVGIVIAPPVASI